MSLTVALALFGAVVLAAMAAQARDPGRVEGAVEPSFDAAPSAELAVAIQRKCVHPAAWCRASIR
ncbi:MAG: hypothetical protein IPP50_01690 [Piscinibacter sp.]|nr:hypothetical protein [Piscinibacter sp.]